MARVEVTSAFLANYAELRGPLTNVLGAFPEWWEVPALPHNVVVYAVLGMELDEGEIGDVFTFLVVLQRPDGTTQSISTAQARRVPAEEVVEGSAIHLVLPIPVPVNVSQLGRHQIVVIAARGDGERKEVARISFGIRIVTPPPPPPGVNFPGFTTIPPNP